MLLKSSTLWYVDAADPLSVLRANHDPDPAAALALAKQLHPDQYVRASENGTLAGCAGAGVDEVFIGCFPGVTVVCSPQATRSHPTELPEFLIRPLASEHTYLVSFDVTHGWGAFAEWERGEFRRSFSSTRVHIMEDEGLPLVWEREHWAGEHPVRWRAGVLPDPQALPFDPPDFADAANNEWIGFRYRAAAPQGALIAADIPVCGFTLNAEPDSAAEHSDKPVMAAASDAAARGRRGILSWIRGHDRVSR